MPTANKRMANRNRDLRAEFLQRYANLPFGARDEIISVIDDDEFTWKSAKIEVELQTKKGKQILKQLSDLGII